MQRILAEPTALPLYNLRLSSLSKFVHSQLVILKSSPSSIALGKFENKLADKMGPILGDVSVAAYRRAASNVNVAPDLSTIRKLNSDALKSAKSAANQVSKSSKTALDIDAAISVKRVASVSRANTISDYQLRLQFFLGTQLGWQLNKKSKKIWNVASSHDKDDSCDDHEAQGAISVFAFFDSGVMYPPAHIGCLCNFALIL